MNLGSLYHENLNYTLQVAEKFHLMALLGKLVNNFVFFRIIQNENSFKFKNIIMQGLWLECLGSYTRYCLWYYSLITKNFVNYSNNIVTNIGFIIDRTRVFDYIVSGLFSAEKLTYVHIGISWFIEIAEVGFVTTYSKNSDFKFAHRYSLTANSDRFEIKVINEKLKGVVFLIGGYGIRIISTDFWLDQLYADTTEYLRNRCLTAKILSSYTNILNMVLWAFNIIILCLVIGENTFLFKQIAFFLLLVSKIMLISSFIISLKIKDIITFK